MSARHPMEARSGIVAIIVFSSLVFLLMQARKDVQSNLSIQEARRDMCTVMEEPDPHFGDQRHRPLLPSGKASVQIKTTQFSLDQIVRM